MGFLFGGGDTPATPPPPPPPPPAAAAPTLANAATSAAGVSQRAKAAAVGALGGTERTGPQGLVDQNTTQRSLLG